MAGMVPALCMTVMAVNHGVGVGRNDPCTSRPPPNHPGVGRRLAIWGVGWSVLPDQQERGEGRLRVISTSEGGRTDGDANATGIKVAQHAQAGEATGKVRPQHSSHGG